MASDRILHIGLGKAGSTTLQKRVFPELCFRRGWTYNDRQCETIRRHLSRLSLGLEPEGGFVWNPGLVSDEGLCSWDPHFWEQYADRNREFFGEDTHVLLILREPRDYLNSIYVQLCLHQGNLMQPEEFFLPAEVYSPLIMNAKFSIGEFGYERLIQIYRTRFRVLTVVKFESLRSGQFLKELVTLEEGELNEYRRNMKRRTNRSFSEAGVRLARFLDRILGTFGFSLRPSAPTSALDDVRNLIGGGRHTKRGRFVNKLSNSLTWRGFIQNVFDRLWPYKKFTLNYELLHQIDILMLEDEYSRLPEIRTFNSGRRILNG